MSERPGLDPAWRRKLARDVGVVLVAALFLALSGAFVGDGTGFGRRFAYWLLAMAVGTLWAEACGRLIGRWIDLDDRPWLGGAVLVLVIAAPLSVTIWALTGPMFGYPVLPIEAMPGFIAPVLMVTAIMTALGLALGRKPARTHAAADRGPPRFLDRLPFRLKGAAIHAVEAEDHYLRIHTDRGSDLILMRLSDAVKELEGLEGAQTHRSWWVARDAVADIARGDGRAALEGQGGQSVPVSRRHARALRAAGWY